MHSPIPYYVAGSKAYSDDLLEVVNKYTADVVASTSFAPAETIMQALDKAEAAQQQVKMNFAQRKTVLRRVAGLIEQRAEEYAELICAEAGKPLLAARVEVKRCVQTFRAAADYCGQQSGKLVAVDQAPGADNYQAMYKLVAVGVCFFITPFNFPLNLVAHKVAPAIAAGCSFILKPASVTPLSALKLGEVLAEAGLPGGMFSIMPMRHQQAGLVSRDPRIRLFSFTGSDQIGWALKQQVSRAEVILELGGNAAAIVDHIPGNGTDIDEDVKNLAQRLNIGAFGQAGQSCISLQRLTIKQELYEPLLRQLVRDAQQVKAGDPRLESTLVGPMIAEKEAIKVERWIADAVSSGARVLVGGERDGSLLQPTLMVDVPEDSPLVCEEVFAPVMVIRQHQDFDQALDWVNASRFGLQAAVFTDSVRLMHKAWDCLQVGGVIINEVATWRSDVMPYGGVKDSGIGREGVVDAIGHMTEKRLLVTRLS